MAKDIETITFEPELPIAAINFGNVLWDKDKVPNKELIINLCEDMDDPRWHHFKTIKRLYNEEVVIRKNYLGYVGDKSYGKIFGIRTNGRKRYPTDSEQGEIYKEQLEEKGLW